MNPKEYQKLMEAVALVEQRYRRASKQVLEALDSERVEKAEAHELEINLIGEFLTAARTYLVSSYLYRAQPRGSA